MTTVNHYNGSPDDCAEDCSANNHHPDDAPQGFVCPRCGGGGACYPTCQEAGNSRWARNATAADSLSQEQLALDLGAAPAVQPKPATKPAPPAARDNDPIRDFTAETFAEFARKHGWQAEVLDPHPPTGVLQVEMRAAGRLVLTTYWRCASSVAALGYSAHHFGSKYHEAATGRDAYKTPRGIWTITTAGPVAYRDRA